MRGNPHRKVCNECGDEKPLTEFHKQKECKFGVRNKCKICAKARAVANYHANRDDRVKRKRKYNAETRDHRLAYLRDYRSQDEKRELINTLRSRWNEANPDRVRANNAKHCVINRARRQQATLDWADKQYITDLYRNVAEAQQLFQDVGLDIKLHVDHIVPIKHDKVCGLHNEFNLQVLRAEENLRKHNNFEIG